VSYYLKMENWQRLFQGAVRTLRRLDDDQLHLGNRLLRAHTLSPGLFNTYEAWRPASTTVDLNCWPQIWKLLLQVFFLSLRPLEAEDASSLRPQER
jgi:hypothetical protein